MSSLPALAAPIRIETPEALADALAARGACWIAGWPDAALRDELRDDLRRLQSAGALSHASVGRGDGRVHRDDIRNDATRWLDDPRCGAPARTFLSRLDDIRQALNRHLFLGLAEFEAHYAVYPPGGGYARHRDRFRDNDARTISWVSYLNADWGPDDGGALRLYLPDATVDLPPCGGSVCFLSELEHEVLPASRERFSIAGWMRRRVGAPV